MTNLAPFSFPRPILPAVISHDHLDELIDVLRAYRNRTDDPTVFVIGGAIGPAPFVVDLRICPLAIASMARCFDYDPGVITILDEAQFEQLRVTVSKAHPTGDIVMTLSSRADALATTVQMTMNRLR